MDPLLEPEVINQLMSPPKKPLHMENVMCQFLLKVAGFLDC